MLTFIIHARVTFKRSHSPIPLAACLGGPSQFRISGQSQRQNYLNTALEFFPEQLGTSKWRDFLRIRGGEHLESARRQNRPIVLAFFHFGPYFLLRYWLRAAGFPAATLVEGRSADRALLKRLKDRVSPYPEIPTAVYHEDQLREMIEFVASRNPLLMALDVSVGKQMNVPVDDGWQFRMASGAIRLAMRERARLIPCSIVDHGGWRFEITLGPPVPDEIMQSGDALRAGSHLLEAMLPIVRAHPEQCTERLVKRFQPMISENRITNEAIHSGQFVTG